MTSLPSNDISNLSNCNQNFSCGNLTNVTYPFTGDLRPSHCGPPEFGLTCEDESVTILKANSLSYRVTHLDQTSQTLRLSRSDLDDDSPCTRQFTNTTLDDRIFSLGSSHGLYLFYGCKKINDSGMGSDPALKITLPVTSLHHRNAMPSLSNQFLVHHFPNNNLCPCSIICLSG
ncbi:hypothetical protein NC652_038489 [Populus alba x Populus x berolinensis]|nr:hypothetical protein NC652_038489 [Populus alba x Populus x berolinensis]